jgi:transcriptional/translational regulatory protein YebC/TACO1
MKIELTKAGLERISNNPTHFSDEQLEDINKLLERLEDDEDVQKIFTNIA